MITARPSTAPCQKTLSITMQNRTGAVNRVLDALSHRGIQPLAFLCTLSQDRQTVQVLVSFEFEDMAGFNKLVKSIQQQVLTLSVHPVISSREVAQGVETATREFLVTSEACTLSSLQGSLTAEPFRPHAASSEAVSVSS
ncbi:MAG: hypothetical protein ACKO37_07955 [Vampirovibrionales bacterium]